MVLETVDYIKYLGVEMEYTYQQYLHRKAYRALGFLRRTLFSCPQDVKAAAYKEMVRPILVYESSVCGPYTDKLPEEQVHCFETFSKHAFLICSDFKGCKNDIFR